MFRSTVLVVAFAMLAAGCVSRPSEPLTVDQQNFRDQQVRLMFARLIANHRAYGATNLFFGRREYSNARISLPRDEKGWMDVVCAKVFIRPLDLIGPREVDLSATVTEGKNGIKLTIGKEADFFGSRCKDPFVPFPELEAQTPKSS